MNSFRKWAFIVILQTLAVCAMSADCNRLLVSENQSGQRFSVGDHILVKDCSENPSGILAAVRIVGISESGELHLHRKFAPNWSSANLHGGISAISPESKLILGKEVKELILSSGQTVRPGDFVVVDRPAFYGDIFGKRIKIARLFSDGTLWLSRRWTPNLVSYNRSGFTRFVNLESNDVQGIVNQ